MRILMLAHCFTHGGANTYRYRNLCEQLSKEGHTVDVVGDKPLNDYTLPENITYTALRKEINALTFIPMLWWSVIYFFKLFALWNKLTNIYITYTILLCGPTHHVIKRLLRKNKYDAVVLSVMPWSYYSMCKMISKSTPLVIDVCDPLYKNAFNDNCFKGSKRYKRLESKAMSFASHIIVVSEPLIELYTKELGVEPSKLSFLSPATDIANYRQNETINYTINHPAKLIYAGMLYPGYRDLDQFSEALKSVDGVTLDAVTNDNIPRNSKITKVGWMAQSELKKRYHQADFILFIDNFYGYQVPSKIYELIATNKPIIFVYDKRNTYLCKRLEHQQGVSIVENNSEQLHKLLNNIITIKTVDVAYDIDLDIYGFEFISGEIIKIIKDVQR